MKRCIAIVFFLSQLLWHHAGYSQCPVGFVHITGGVHSLCDSSVLDWASFTTASVTDTSGAATISSSLSILVSKPTGGLSVTPSVYNGSVFPTQYNVPINSVTLRSDLAGLFTFCYSTPVLNPQIALASIGSTYSSVQVNTSDPYVVIWAGQGMSYPSNMSFIGTEGYTIVQFPGVHTCISFDYLQSESYCNICFGVLDTNCQTFISPTVCAGSSDSIVAHGAVSYVWSPATGLNTTTGPIVIAHPLVSTTYHVTGTDANGCTAADSVTIHVSLPYSDTVSEIICQGSSYSFDGHSYTAPGYYVAHYHTTVGCDSDITLHLTLYPSYSDTVSHGICPGTIYTYDGLSYAQPGYYSTSYTAASGCDSTIILHLTIAATYSDTFDAHVCAGGSYVFNGQAYSMPGYFAASYHTIDGCDSIVTLHLAVGDFSDTTVVHLCRGDTYSYQGVTYSSSGTYTFHYTSTGGCDSDFTLVFVINPTYYDTLYRVVCSDRGYMLPDGTVVDSTGLYTSRFLTASGCDSLITTVVTVYPVYHMLTIDTVCAYQKSLLPDGSTVTGGGTFLTSFSTVNSCDSTIETRLIVDSEPDWFQVHITPPSATIDEGATLALAAYTDYAGPIVYSWYPAMGLSCSDCAAPTFTADNSATYTLLIIDTNGCRATATTIMQVVFNHDIFIPDAFTPNGDGINDLWQAFANRNAIKQIDVTVFDRWGEKVYQSSDIDFGWDGSYRGKPLVPGLFVYTIDILWVDKAMADSHKGSITLIR